ncbi:MAG: hypothetical protein VKO44_05545 [Cyanobacteriota bacterium]|jgi:hypothetical protein|nr:hypothetical protein [Cyanobacteriota bacterium]
MNQDVKVFLERIAAESPAAFAELFAEGFAVDPLSDAELEGIAGGAKNSAATVCRPLAICRVTDFGLNCLK